MPTYNYKCLSCEKKFVVFQKMSDSPISNCKYCSSEKVEKIIGAGAGLIFKGSGFYLTDYKDNSKKHKSTKHKKIDKE
tara:strand:+ start:488 stop:721 length:234 start_codon:yes stop_codon:yes gene_type:complete